jgi:FkbM family methyltransferase
MNKKNERMRSIKKKVGLLRSRLIYDFKPGAFRRLHRFYQTFVKPCDLCFDIGAHTGNHSKVWQQLNARVVIIEPQPVFAEHLRKKFNSYPSVVILQQAVAEREGVKILNINSSNPTISTIDANWKTVINNYDNSREIWDEEIEVVAITLDNLIGRYGMPSFCKIDVEGSEEKVLEGLSHKLPALSFEFFPTTPERSIACIERLERLGLYRYNLSFTEKYRFESDVWKDSKGIKKTIERYTRQQSGDIYAFSI